MQKLSIKYIYTGNYVLIEDIKVYICIRKAAFCSEYNPKNTNNQRNRLYFIWESIYSISLFGSIDTCASCRAISVSVGSLFVLLKYSIALSRSD